MFVLDMLIPLYVRQSTDWDGASFEWNILEKYIRVLGNLILG